uniref:Sulfotransferase n=3 Tax=Kalanchoe fedtschenkoi TaxID=63787 RepID=A0A7N0V911_KALFE
MEGFRGTSQDTLVIKAPKRSPLILRTVVILFVMVCGVYICSITVKQSNAGDKSTDRYLNVDTKDQTCPDITGVEESQLQYLHYPKPKTFTRDECACNPVRYFAILSMQRSGSGWFETLLNNHTNVSSNGEIFSVAARRSNVSTVLDTMDKVYNLDWFTSASKNDCSAAVGFKWMLNQGLMKHHAEVAEYFNRNGVSAIFLFRRNPLRRMISVLANSYDSKAKLLNGTHKSHVHSPLEAKILANYKPTVPVKSLVQELVQVEEDSAKAISYFNSTRHIVLYYEDLIRDRTKLVDVQKFLKLPYRELKSRQVKIHTGPLSHHVANWDEIKKTLNGTSYEKFLHSSY